MKKKKINLLLIIIFIMLSISSLFIGVKGISIKDAFSLHNNESTIIMISRLPRLLSIIITGAGMSVSGIIMQQISRNKFVSPTTAGTVEFTKLGIAVAIIMFSGAGLFTKMSIAFLFSLFGTFVFIKVIGRIKFKDAVFIPLVGMMIGGIIDSITTFLTYRNDLIQNVSSWMQGDFSLIMKGRYELLYIGIPVFVIAFIYANKFTIVGMGEDFATNLGLNHRQVMNIGLVIVSLMISVVVITIGSIPFLGLIVPNIVSIYNGDNLRANLCYTIIAGPIFLLICDIAGRLIIYPYEIPIGTTAGTIGSAVFLYLILRRRKNEK